MITKNIVKLIAVVVILAGSQLVTFAQNTSIASVSATITTPISIVKNVDLNFGIAAVAATTGGTIVLAPAGTRSTGGSGVTLPSTTGTVAAANFTVSGAPTYTYTITLPSTAAISGPGAAAMTVNGFTSSPSATGTLNSSGTQTLSIGATLTLAAAQTPGVYTNASAIPVTVNYN